MPRRAQTFFILSFSGVTLEFLIPGFLISPRRDTESHHSSKTQRRKVNQFLFGKKLNQPRFRQKEEDVETETEKNGKRPFLDES